LDWLLAGIGEMMLGQGNKTAEPAPQYAKKQGMSERAKRMCLFIEDFMALAPDDEQIWLEMQLKMHVPQYVKFLEQHHDE